MVKGVTKKKAKKPKLTAAERARAKLQNDHRSDIRGIFTGSGFRRMSGIADKQFTFDGQTADVDDIFIFENLIVVAEYTCTKSSEIGSHLKPKKIIFDKILADPNAFTDFISNTFPDCAGQFPIGYHKSQTKLKIVYCSRFDFDSHYKTNVPGPIYFDYSAVRYFKDLVAAIKRSSRYEIIQFLKIQLSDIGKNGKINVSDGSQDYPGLILPEAHSNFKDGHKIVSFYTDPEALLRTAYVLRKDGWRESPTLYQRRISKTKIDRIRAYLKREERVFVNNIIVTLPPDVKPLNPDKTTVHPSKLNDTAPVLIRLPDRANSVGVIDGQHRIFAYHETRDDDAKIAKLRQQQNLLVTGIIFPEGFTPAEQEHFEAKLFLEINDNQTKVLPNIRQAIQVVLEPYSVVSIAARVLSGLSKFGPLSGEIQQYYFDTNKLKTGSIVNYGLASLVKTSGTDSLFSIWSHAEKEGVVSATNATALEEYISFCVSTINLVLAAIRKNIPAERWTTERKVEGRVLSTVAVNSFLIVTRMLVEKNVLLTEQALGLAFKGIADFDFGEFRSSQYARMAEKIIKTHF